MAISEETECNRYKQKEPLGDGMHLSILRKEKRKIKRANKMIQTEKEEKVDKGEE